MAGNSETQKLSATELFLWQLCKTYAREFPDPARPVSSELVSAFVPRVVRLLVLVRLMPDVLRRFHTAPIVFPEFWHNMEAEAANLFESYACDLVSEIAELDTFLHDPGLDEAGCGDWLVAEGYSYQQVQTLLNRAAQYQQGRRPSKRLSTVAALEYRRLNGSSWRQLAENFCDCENPLHGSHCREAMRKSVAHLESTLKNYQKRSIPAELLAPLANMFLDELGWKHSG